TLRGLECARVRRRGGTHAGSFGVGRERERLDCEAAWERFAALVADLARLRAGDAPDRLHAAYRAEPERWLASLLADDVTRGAPCSTSSPHSFDCTRASRSRSACSRRRSRRSSSGSTSTGAAVRAYCGARTRAGRTADGVWDEGERGGDRNRTDGGGFADLCLSTWLRRLRR